MALEDNSEHQVAETIFRIYETCAQGDTSLARQMVAHAESAVAFNSQFPVQLQTTEHDEDDEDMEGAQDNIVQAHPETQATPIQIPTDYNSKPLFGEAPKTHMETGPVRQLGEMVSPIKEAVEMDEDGFAPVKPKGRRKG